MKILNTKLLKKGMLAAAVGLAMPLSAAADTLRMAIPADPGYLDPAYWGSTVEQILIDNLYPRLAKYAPGDEWMVELDAAKSVDLSDPQHIAFELKPGIMWSGGFGELTAEDVEYSFERHLDENLGSGVYAEFALLEDVEVTGKYTGIIHLSAPSPSFWTSTLTFTSGAIISKAAAEAAGGYFEGTPTATTGPYRFKSHEAGFGFVLESNPDWSGEPATFDEIVLIPIADDNALRVAFEADEIDYGRVSALNYDLYQAAPPRGADVRLMPSLDTLWMGISETHPSLSDVRVRHAIQRAIDIPAIIAATTSGHAEMATGIISPGLPGHRAASSVSRDVEAAKALIAEAGAEGTTIRLDYVNWATRASAAQIIQANLAEIGLNVELNGQDEGTFWSVDEARAAELQLHLKAWVGNPDGLYTLQYFTSDQVGYWNWEGLANADYDQMVVGAKRALTLEASAEILVSMQDILEESGDFLFIAHEPLTMITREGMNIATLPDGRPVFAASSPTAN